MAEVLFDFDGILEGIDDRAYEARACARERADGLWEGWLEFVPMDGSAALRTGRETTQPDRANLEYWASGLTDSYLDGALLRVLRPTPTVRSRSTSIGRPAFDEPAALGSPSLETVQAAPRAVLDPFAVYAEGDEILTQQLDALSDGQLRAIVRAYGLSNASVDALNTMDKPALMGTIVAAVRRGAA